MKYTTGINNTVALPFYGFYESIHHDIINSTIEGLAEVQTSDHYRVNETLLDFLNDHVNFPKVFEEYAKDYARYVSIELEEVFKFKLLDSPRFYNYSTDRVICTIRKEAMQRIYAEACKHNGKLLREKTRDNYTGYFDQPELIGDFLKQSEHPLFDTVLEVYVDSYYPEGFDHNYIDSRMGWYDNLRESVFESMGADGMEKYNTLFETLENKAKP